MSSSRSIAESLSQLEGLLRLRAARGEESLSVSAAALDQLRVLPDRLSEAAGQSLSGGEEAVAAGGMPPGSVSPDEGRGSLPRGDLPREERNPVSRDERPVDEIRVREEDSGAQDGEERLPIPAEGSNRDKLIAIFHLAKRCPVCTAMETLFDTMVFATGDPEASLAFVGEAPGAEEEQKKRPFVGPAGQKLDQIIRAMGLEREKVYISNIVKFRPRMDDWKFQGKRNRKPTPHEMTSSVKYVKAELEVVRPRAVVALGATAAEGLLEESGSVRNLRGKWHDLDGIPVMVTYHPSYLLRQEGESPEAARKAKRLVWEDMLLVMEKIGLPISEKQRKYFA